MRDLMESIENLSTVIPKHIISMKDLNRSALEYFFDVAHQFSKLEPHLVCDLLTGKVAGTMFYQPSTRTRLNFHSALQRLGVSVIGFSDPATTRAGDYYRESLEDVVAFTGQLCDILVLRHNETGAAQRAVNVSPVPLISAGDGYNEHPTQALGDIWTMHKELNGLDRKVIGMIGDLAIRSLRSITIGLSEFNIKKLLFLLPPGMQVPSEIEDLLKNKNITWELVDQVDELLNKADLIESIGVRHPNHNLKFHASLEGATTPKKYLLTSEVIRKNKRYIPILHPGPRTDEISCDVDKLDNAAYFRQANNGMWMRMAIISGLLFKGDKVKRRARMSLSEMVL
jgi:aspartate carbamoyltransferase catalytic subunit